MRILSSLRLCNPKHAAPLAAMFLCAMDLALPSAGNACGQAAGNQAIAGDIEVLDFEQFSTSNLRIGCIDTTNAGQSFLDRSASPWTLNYLANPGENPNTDLVMVRQLPLLLQASGLQYITFRGLTFMHDSYMIPATGHKSSELEADISAVVSFQNSSHITFDSGVVTQASGAGLEFIPCKRQIPGGLGEDPPSQPKPSNPIDKRWGVPPAAIKKTR